MEPVTVEVLLDGEPILSDERLAERLAERVAAHPDVQGIVQCDAEAPVARMVTMIDLLRTAGVRKYAIATRPHDEQP